MLYKSNRNSKTTKKLSSAEMKTFQITMLSLLVVLISSVAGFPAGHPCNGVVCLHNGTCGPWGFQNGFKCFCQDGFVGTYCEAVNPCDCVPCHNGGTCKVVGVDFRCFCPTDYMGKRCDKVSPCKGKTCPPGQHCAPYGTYSHKCFPNN